MKPVGDGQQRIVLKVEAHREQMMSATILEVLGGWGCMWMWMWKSLRLVGNDNWLEEAIEAGTCIAVTGGLYIKEWYPNVCSAAFILECSKGREWIVGSLPEQTMAACAHCGNLLGLMAKYSKGRGLIM